MIYAISIAYFPLEIMENGISQFYKTNDIKPDKWILVDNKWPLPQKKPFNIKEWAKNTFTEILEPKSNQGCHGGQTLALKHLSFEDNDLILIYDLDSNPVSTGWLKAMSEVMYADPGLGSASLLHPAWNAEWTTVKHIAGHKVAFLNRANAWGVTLFRGKILKEGMKAWSKYYGFTEHAMYDHMRNMNLCPCYMFDFWEAPYSLSQDVQSQMKILSNYKYAHAFGSFNGKFEQYLANKKRETFLTILRDGKFEQYLASKKREAILRKHATSQ